MNLAQIKTALEDSVRQAVESSIDQKVKVSTSYDANQEMMVIEVKDEGEVKDNRSSTLCYNIKYSEQTKETMVMAFNRTVLYDALGPVVVTNEPVAVSSGFMASMQNVIEFGLDRGYNPDRYKVDEKAENEQAEGDVVLDGNAEE